jgi:type IV fimbrial biogenesis protein FimT
MIELMVAIAIGALLIFLAAPSFTTFLRNSEIRSTSESIVNGLRARSDGSRQPQQASHVRAYQWRNERRLAVLGPG